ncbi:uncharacterized protein LOC143527552 isoform X2 [Brachyhypopomus gauderio]
MMNLTGGWLLYKATGGNGQRTLSVLTQGSQGYTAKMLKTSSNNGKHVLYIMPLQERLDTAPLPHDAWEFSKMPKSECKRCGTTMPLQLLVTHIQNCGGSESENEEIQECQEPEDRSTECPDVYLTECKPMDTCPVCGVQFPPDILFAHASSCGESFDNERPSSSADHDVDEATAVPHQNQETSSNSTVTSIVTDNNAWKKGEDPQGAALLFRRQILQQYERSSPLTAILDLGDSVLDRERSILTFYKALKVNWVSPLHCTLRGDAAVGDGVNRHFISLTMNTLQHGFRLNYGNTDVMLLFEGQPDHLVPCTSQILLDSDLFLIAGRMVGHSFLHGGPALAGISEAVVDVLFGASPDMTTITVEDCPDLERRQIIQLLDGNKDLSEEEKDAVWILADMWDLPGVTSDNRKWLFNRLLHHAVLGRTEKQIKQFRRGLKETCVWQLLTERKDVIPLMFPRERDVEIKPHMVLDQILWPLEKTDEEDEDYPVETRCRIAGYLREFIATASQSSLKGLVQFWTGWEVPSSDMQLEIVQGSLPKASTCFKSLRLPGHYTNFKDFSRDLNSCVATCDTGFGLV